MEMHILDKLMKNLVILIVFGMADIIVGEDETNIFTFFPNINSDASRVTWAHGVNSKSQLTEALQSDILMLEADISQGYVIGNETGDAIPIMAHPPSTVSDISLQEWIEETLSSGKRKGIKLDFKNVEIVESSLKMLATLDISVPLFLNADILSGPVNASSTPVNASKFLTLVKTHYPKCILSVGWTTSFDPITISNNFYSWNHVMEMVSTLKQNNIENPITFPIRASFTAHSYQQLKWLTDVTPNSGLTIWSAKDDSPDLSGLVAFLENYPPSCVYYDLHEHLTKDYVKLRQSHLKMASGVEKSGKLSSFAWLIEDDGCATVGSETIVLHKNCLVIYMDKFEGSITNPLVINGVVEFLQPQVSCGSKACLDNEDALGIGLRSSPWIWVQIFNSGSINRPVSGGYRKDLSQNLISGNCYRFRIVDTGSSKPINVNIWSCSANSGANNYPPIGEPAIFELPVPEKMGDTMQMALSSVGTRVKVVHSLEISALSGSAPSGSAKPYSDKMLVVVGLTTVLVSLIHLMSFL